MQRHIHDLEDNRLLGADERADDEVLLPSRGLALALSMELSRFPQSVRARIILDASGIRKVGDLARMTENEVRSLKNCGLKTLFEFRDILASVGLKFGMLGFDANNPSSPVSAEMGEKADALGITDPGRHECDTVPPRFDSEVSHCLEDELCGLASKVANARHREILVKFFGWTGQGKRTLQSVASEHRLTRERVRQVSAKAGKNIARMRVDAPWLSKALKLVARECPATAENLACRLQQAGISKSPFDPSGLLTAAAVLGKPRGFARRSIGTTVCYVRLDQSEKLAQFFRSCRRSTGRQGCANFEATCDDLGISEADRMAFRNVATVSGECEWLDEERGWLFHTHASRNRLSNLIMKVLHISQRVTVSELRHAVSRSRRLPTIPPTAILGKFVNRMCLGTQVGEVIEAIDPFPNALAPGGAEEIMISVLRENGPVLSWDRFQELCANAGVNTTTFSIYVSGSPAFVRLARGVYALVGAHVEPGAVEEAVKELASDRKPCEWGWTATGGLWCAIYLTRPILTSGATYVPQFVSQYIEGEWKLARGDHFGNHLLKCREGFLWGIARALLNAGAEPGDTCVFEFVRESRVVRFMLGNEELADAWEAGDVELSRPNSDDEEVPESA